MRSRWGIRELGQEVQAGMPGCAGQGRMRGGDCVSNTTRHMETCGTSLLSYCVWRRASPCVPGKRQMTKHEERITSWDSNLRM